MAEWNLLNHPPGFRFSPIDTEVIGHLRSKNHDSNIRDFIPVYDINQFTPPDRLPRNCPTRGRNGELYFYTPRDPNKPRQRRSVGRNYVWRSAAKSHPITDNGEVVGFKRSLALRIRRGQVLTRTNWMMLEYSQATANSPEGATNTDKDGKDTEKVGDFVLCKIYKNAQALKGDDEEDNICEFYKEVQALMEYDEEDNMCEMEDDEEGRKCKIYTMELQALM